MSINIYKILKLISGNRIPAPIKLLGISGMHLLGRRTIGIFIDPVFACNLRCRMCYFSDSSRKGQLKGNMSDEELDKVEKALFHRALKLQIGCGAEPTLYPRILDLVIRGRRAGIPYISLTTNGQLIATGRVNLEELVEAGLNEITLSMHGTDRETYEYLMPGAKFDNLCRLIDIIGDVKRRFPKFIVRINFTVNSMNVQNLSGDRFWKIWDGVSAPDIVQLRPVQNFGDTAWTDFDHTPLKDSYEETIGAVIKECQRRGITCIAPTIEQIDAVDDVQDAVSSIIEDFSYCYVAHDSCYKNDFNIETDTYESYHKRKHTGWQLIKSAFRRNSSRHRNVSKKLNYDVKS